VSSHGPTGGAAADIPVISILTTAYRTEEYLAETIDSVRAQTFPLWELVVVDNGMSDEVVRIVERYAHDERIRLVRKENEGYARGVDAAAAVARGRYLAVLDSDDLLSPRYCERMVALFAEHPEVDAFGPDSVTFVHGGHRRFRTHLQRLGYWRRPRVEHRLTLADVLGGYQPSDGAAVRRTAWDAIGGYGGTVRKVEDLSTYLRLIEAGFDVRAIPDRLLRFRARPDSESRDPARLTEFADAIETALTTAADRSGRIEDLMAAERRIRRTRAMFAVRRAGEALRDHDDAAALRAAREAHLLRPTTRTALIVASLSWAPGLLRELHLGTKRLAAAGARAARPVQRV
jgi:GT2 family glycosyltransferase